MLDFVNAELNVNYAALITAKFNLARRLSDIYSFFLLLSLLRRCWLCDQTCSLFDTQSWRMG